jgi:hypothetical protein
MRKYRALVLFLITLVISCFAFLCAHVLVPPAAATASLLAPAPRQPIGFYDYFGQLLSPRAAANLVRQQELRPRDPDSYARIGAVQITQELIDQGEAIFLNRKIGDTLGLQRVFGFTQGFATIFPEVTAAIANLQGQPTSNLVITLQKTLTLGNLTLPQGASLPTGLDVAADTSPGGFPVGFPGGALTCAACHVAIAPTGEKLKGVPNGDLAIPLLVALAPNSAAGFARLNINPLDPQFQGNGKTIYDSNGNLVQLPDPQKFEQAFDTAVLAVPYGHFESSPDGIDNTTQIPSVFTFKTHPYLADGQFAVGPFAGLAAINNAVHSSEINLLAAAQNSVETIGIDREVYLGTVLQNAADPRLRLPAGPVKPSEWLRQVAPELDQAELEDQIAAPGAGRYPNLKPSLFTYNGLIFTPPTDRPGDIASGKFLFADIAMAAWQNSLVSPSNQTPANQQALATGSVQRGARIFAAAQCLTCHKAPFFTDNRIHPVKVIKTNPVRAQSRLKLNPLLVSPQMYALNTPVPIPADAEVLDIPTAGIAKTPTTLPKGILPKGGYKTTPLLGLYLSPPYLHDGGAAVRQGTLDIKADGSFTIADPSGLGLSGTLSQGIPADAAESLRALLDRNLRRQVIATNQANPALALSNLDGKGHNFYVDAAAGYTPAQQTDLINFLLALDDDPGKF